jgi:tRNA 2-thiouridine synthesizing protein C
VPKPLFIFTQAPHNNPQAREGVESLLASAAFDQQPAVLFMGQGVLQLVPQGEQPGAKNLNKMLQALELYGVEHIYICRDSLATYALTPDLLTPSGQLIGQDECCQVMQQSQWAVRF